MTRKGPGTGEDQAARSLGWTGGVAADGPTVDAVDQERSSAATGASSDRARNRRGRGMREVCGRVGARGADSTGDQARRPDRMRRRCLGREKRFAEARRSAFDGAAYRQSVYACGAPLMG
ncbi:hypothetical protein GCM10009768_17490 [Leucobacter iarius]|uniref:Uncharacterized protein n=1 Tax=Leucobacter iarius TaxID=333963 RepID=A0ABN2LHJ6_9MICO